MLRFKLLIVSLTLLFSSLPAQAVFADTGPKPTMDFEFKQDLPNGPVTIVSGTFYECQQADCSDAKPLVEGGPQRFTCGTDSCHALAYGFATYHRLEIKFSDGKTRQSNIFTTQGFDGRYTVTVRPDDLLVEEQFGSLTFGTYFTLLCLFCCCPLIVVGLIVGAILFFVRRAQQL